MFHEANNFFDYGVVFLAVRSVDTVVHVYSCDRLVRWYHNDIELVNVPELACFSLCCTGHARKLVVHSEVVLQSDCSECLCCSLHFDVFLCLERLVESVGVAAAVHYTSGLLINDKHLVVHNDVFLVFAEQCVCSEQLVDCVQYLGLRAVVLHQLVFLACLFLLAQRFVFLDFCYFCADIRQHEELRVILGLRQHVDTLVCQLYSIVSFVYHKVQRVCSYVHVAVVLGNVEFLGFQQCLFDSRLAEEFDERCVLRQRFVAAEQ